MRATLTTVTAIGLMAIPTTAYGHGVDIDVLSSRADQVSGGDALVRVDAPQGLLKLLRVERNGDDVTSAFGAATARSRASSTACATARTSSPSPQAPSRRARAARQPPDHRPDLLRPAAAAVRLQDQPDAAAQRLLGEPLVDNQAGQGFRVLRAGRHDGRLEPRLQRRHRRRLPLPHHRRAVQPLPADEPARRTWPRPRRWTAAPSTSSSAASAARSTASSTRYAMLRRRRVERPPGLPLRRRRGDRPQPGHARRLLAGPELLGLGYAIAHSSGTRTSVHYNLAGRRRDGADDQGALRRALRRAAATRSASAAPAARSSSTSTARTTRGLLDAGDPALRPTRTW